MDISDVEHAALANPEVMAAVAEARTAAAQGREPVRRPGIGIAIDRHKLKALREAALLERIDLSDLSKITELRAIAWDNDIPGHQNMGYDELVAALAAKGVPVPRHIGISRDAIAKIENGDRLRPKISTLRTIIDTLNTALVLRGERPVGIADLYPVSHDGGQQPNEETAEEPIGETAAGPGGDAAPEGGAQEPKLVTDENPMVVPAPGAAEGEEPDQPGG